MNIYIGYLDRAPSSLPPQITNLFIVCIYVQKRASQIQRKNNMYAYNLNDVRMCFSNISLLCKANLQSIKNNVFRVIFHF